MCRILAVQIGYAPHLWCIRFEAVVHASLPCIDLYMRIRWYLGAPSWPPIGPSTVPRPLAPWSLEARFVLAGTRWAAWPARRSAGLRQSAGLHPAAGLPGEPRSACVQTYCDPRAAPVPCLVQCLGTCLGSRWTAARALHPARLAPAGCAGCSEMPHVPGACPRP